MLKSYVCASQINEILDGSVCMATIKARKKSCASHINEILDGSVCITTLKAREKANKFLIFFCIKCAMGLSQDIFILPAYIDLMLPESLGTFHDKSNFSGKKKINF